MQGLSVLHLKRGSTPPSRSGSLKAKQQAVWNVGTIAPTLYNLSRKRHVIQMCCFNNVRSLTHESSPQLKDVCMDLHRSVTPSGFILRQIDTGAKLCQLVEQEKRLDQCYYQLYLIKYLYISTTKKSIFRYSINMYNIYIYIYIYMYIYTHIYIHIYIYIHTYIYIV